MEQRVTPDKQSGPLRRTLSRLLHGLNTLRMWVVNLIFLLLLLAFIGALATSGGGAGVPSNAALVLDLSGRLVEQLTPTRPLSGVLGSIGSFSVSRDETLLKDVIASIDAAAKDTRIKLIVLQLDELDSADFAKLSAVGVALKRFEQANKKVIAIGDSYNQEQYYLASYADEVYMHPMGQVLVNGFSQYDLFVRQALEKMNVNVHVFRVGQFKAAVEPFLRDDMSPEAKTANTAVINVLWQQYKARIAANRDIDVGVVEQYMQRFAQLTTATRGDLASLALQQRLIDELLSRNAVRERLMKRLGTDHSKHDYAQISFRDYARANRVDSQPGDKGAGSNNDIAVLNVRGTIVVDDEGGGSAGANQLSGLIRDLRYDDRVKAVVVRVDSPGGSAFGSEIIRAELELLQSARKPVVVSMSGLAASGGYWISATADEIWADPTTLTGSIGIFGIAPTFETALDKIGMHADGVANSPMGAGMEFVRGIHPDVATVLQENVNFGYHQFIALVARGRNLPAEQVESIAQGRVWTGADALQNHLVDHLGGLDMALAAAAKRAHLTDYHVRTVQREWSTKEKLLHTLFDRGATDNDARVAPAVLTRWLGDAWRELNQFAQLDDPRSIYALCDRCGML